MATPPIQSQAQRRHTLTDRQIEVAALAAQGLRDGEIAQVLQITEATVSNHLSHIFIKLNINSRHELKYLLAQWQREDGSRNVEGGARHE